MVLSAIKELSTFSISGQIWRAGVDFRFYVTLRLNKKKQDKFPKRCVEKLRLVILKLTVYELVFNLWWLTPHHQISFKYLTKTAPTIFLICVKMGLGVRYDLVYNQFPRNVQIKHIEILFFENF